MPVLNVVLDPTERDALSELAHRERRNIKAQAAVIIRRELERAGLLPIEPMQPPGHPAQVEARDSTYAK